jgi:hypothetical protein
MISDGSMHRWAPIGFSGVTVALSSSFSVNGSSAMSARRSLNPVGSFSR